MSVAVPNAPALLSPYKGLAPFEDSEQDALFFFGRERECEVAVANLLASKLTVLYGPSGVGKSSMLKAAVVRRMRELEPDAQVIVLADWAGEPELPEPEGEMYLILDQFEEYFLYHGEGRLLDELPELLRLPRVHVLISLRDDSLSRLDAFQARIPNVFANRLSIDHLDRAAAHAAIVGPIDRWNEISSPEVRVGIEAGLVTAVLDEVAAAPAGNGSSAAGLIEAPYLQLVMERVWEEEQAAGSRLLRLGTLERLGGARAIVSAHLERTLGALEPHEAAIAASALTYLVTPSRTKIAQSFDDLAGYTDERPAELRSVLDLLAAQRILRVASIDGGGRRYEIFHDVLAEPVLAWRRNFTGHAALERERRRRRRVTAFAVAALLLAAAMAGLAVWAVALRADASRQRRVAERTAQYALGQKKIAQRRRVAALAARQKAIVARRHALGSAALAKHNEQLAQQNADQATKSEQQAQASNQQAQASATAATKSANQAQKSKKYALRERQAAQKQAQLYKQAARKNKIGELVARSLADLTIDPARSVQAALSASTLDPSSNQVEDALRGALQALQVRAILHGGGGPVNDASFSPDGDLVATGAGSGNLRVFRTGGHTMVQSHALGSAVATVAFGPETATTAAAAPSGLLAAGTRDGRVVLYDIVTGKLLRTLPDGAGILDVVFADGGREVVTGDAANSLRIWDTATGTLLRTIAGTHPVQTIAVSPSGLLAAIVQTGDPVIRVYSIPSGNLVASPPQTGEATDAAFSPDGKYLATTGRRNGYVWETTTWSQLHLLVGHEAAIDDVIFAPDDRIVTASIDSSVRVWDAATGAGLATLLGQSQQKMLAVAVSPDGGQIAAAGADPVVRIWATPLGAIPRPLAGHTDSVTRVSYNGDGSLLLTASADGTARLWATAVPVLAPLGSHPAAVSTVAYSPDGKHVLSAGSDGTARVWNAGGGLALTLQQSGAVTDATYTLDRQSILTAGQDGTAKLWSAADGLLRTTFAHGAPVRAVVSAPGGVVVTSGDDGNVKAWTSAGRLLWTAQHGSPVAALAVAKDGTIASGAADGTVRLWRARDGAPLYALRGHTGAITSLAFDRAGDVLASGSVDHTARIWNVSTGALVHRLTGHQFGVTSVAFSPDGKLLVTASVDGDAWLWHVATGRVFKKLRFHVSTVSQAVFSPDGRWVVTAGPSAAGLWQTRTGKLIMYLHGAKGTLTSAAWAPDSQRFVVGDTGGGVETYRCTLCGRIPALRAQAKTALNDINR
jgi:WD40 repeat protein